MSHPIPARQRCAGTSCNRIDLIPSQFAASAWYAWLMLACTVTWFAVSLPWLARFTICAAVAGAGVRGLRAFVRLEGPRAVRAIEWNDADDLSIWLGASPAPLPVTLANGSFRLGARFWVLRFVTPVGPRSVLVEEAARDIRAFRRLSRRLNGHLRRGSGRSRRPAVTIRPKV
jgi:hypothetical protein